MVRNKVIGSCLLATVIFVTFFYNVKTMWFLLAFCLVLPVFLEMFLSAAKNHIEVLLPKSCLAVTRGEAVSWQIQIKNTGWLPISCLRLLLSFEDCFQKTKEKKEYLTAVDGRSQWESEKEEVTLHCGQYRLQVDEVILYDYLRLFSRKKKEQQSIRIKVLPKIYEIPVNLELDLSTDFEEDEQARPRPDPAGWEMAGIRPYRPRDTLSRIHWKAAARMDELMVKETESYPRRALWLLLDYSGGEQLPGEERDDFLERAVSLAAAYLRREIPVCTVWLDGKGEIAEKRMEKPCEAAELAELLVDRLLSPQEGSRTLLEAYIHSREADASIIVLPMISDEITQAKHKVI